MGFESLWYGLAKTTPSGSIVIDSNFYSKIDAVNADLFLGTLSHEVIHFNRTDFWDKAYDLIPMRFNEGHRIIDGIAEQKGNALYGKFKEETGCCSF